MSELSTKAAGGLDLCVFVFLGTGSDSVIPVVGMNELELLAKLCTCLIYLGFSKEAKVSEFRSGWTRSVFFFLGTGNDTFVPVVGMNELELLAKLCTCLIYLGFSEQAKVS